MAKKKKSEGVEISAHKAKKPKKELPKGGIMDHPKFDKYKSEGK